MLSDENDVATLSDCLTEWMPNLWNPDQTLVKGKEQVKKWWRM